MRASHAAISVLLLLAVGALGCCGENGQKFVLGEVATLELFVDQTAVAPGGAIPVSSGYLLPGEEAATAIIRLINTGTANLAISDIVVESDPPETFRLATNSISLDPLPKGAYTIVPQDADAGQPSLVAQVVVKRPARGVTPTGRIHIRSNSVAAGIQQPEIVYELRLKMHPPKLVVVPEMVDFGSVPAGESRQRTVTVDNQGGDLLVIDRVLFKGHDGFAGAFDSHNWSSAPDADAMTIAPPLEIAPGKQASARVQYAATGPENAVARLLLFSNDPVSTLGSSVALMANAGAPSAPVVGLEAPNGASGQVTCQLLSEAVDQETLTYTWYWRLGEGDAFTTFAPTLGADKVKDCDRVQCWTEVTDGQVVIPSNIAETILPFGFDCDDHSVCTDDSCGPLGGCAATDNTLPCTDGDLCNGAEVCANGRCGTGTPIDCSVVADPCIQLACNPETGRCDLAKPDNAPCSDTNLCNGFEVCKAGTCQPGVPIDCSGVTNPCLDETCNPASGLCDLSRSNGTPCVDSNLCNGAETCQGGVCQAGILVDCSGVTNPCLLKTCNPLSGLCNQHLPNDSSCADGDRCNGDEACQGGVCQIGSAVDCTANANPCLQKTCNAVSGLCDLPRPDGTSCDDSDLCSTASSCLSGACTASSSVVCAQGTDPCQESYCDSSTGECRSRSLNGGMLNRLGRFRFAHRSASGDAIDFVGWGFPGAGFQDAMTIFHRQSNDGLSDQTSTVLEHFQSWTFVEADHNLLLVGKTVDGSATGEIRSYLVDNSWHVVATSTLAPESEASDVLAVIKVSEGFVAVGGTPYENGTAVGGRKISLLYLDQTGAIVRESTFQPDDLSFGVAVAEQPDGGLLVFGAIYVPPGQGGQPGERDRWSGRILTDGSLAWSRRERVGMQWYEQLSRISDTLSIQGGRAVPPNLGPVVMVIDNDGNIIERYDYVAETTGSSENFIMPIADGGWLIGGYRQPLSNPSNLSWGYLLRARADGSVIWEKEFTDFAFEPFHAMPYPRGAFLLSGRRLDSPGWIESPAWIIIDENGDLCGSQP